MNDKNSDGRKVLISILNWNGAKSTLRCIDSLEAQDTAGFDIQVSVIDNGSRPEDWQFLSDGVQNRDVRVTRMKTNTGFAGGHNVSIRAAIDQGIEFVWLVNNDATVYPNALKEMIAVMDGDAKCGAVAPVSVAEHDATHIDFAGARHDWANLRSIRLSSATETAAFERTHPDDMWISGAAVLFRTSALKQIGHLDEALFAYFEDNDISARLAAGGWTNRVAFKATIVHGAFKGGDVDRPPYFFYLMQRNSFRFWRRNTPRRYHRWLNLRLLDRSLYEVNKLYYQGFKELGDAALLGTSDGFWGRTGTPRLDRRPALSIVLLKKVFNMQHSRALARLKVNGGHEAAARG